MLDFSAALHAHCSQNLCLVQTIQKQIEVEKVRITLAVGVEAKFLTGFGKAPIILPNFEETAVLSKLLGAIQTES